MSSSESDCFEEFARIENEDSLDFVTNPRQVQYLAETMPMIVRPTVKKVASLCCDDRFYGDFCSWYVYGRVGRLYLLLRWPQGLQDGRCWELAVARAPEDRHCTFNVSWLLVEAGVRSSIGSYVYGFLSESGEMGLVHFDEYRQVGLMPSRLPIGGAALAIDTRGETPEMMQLLVINSF